MAVGYAKLYELILKKVKDELRSELATKEDILILEEKMNSIKEEILRYVDSKFHQLDKKFTIFFIIILFAIIITNPNAIELIKLLFGIK